ncbi:SH3 domain-containing protein, partial [Virgibacillus sp. MSJ-26]|uniref:N-acetylglucosaminidase n=1 Tax=Virgibacillus sp. MSJ-26 TaxID=2841522 RepID=UPI001C11E262
VNDVETFPDKQTTQNGLAAKSPTNVYQSPTKDKVLKSYKKGTILKYKTLTSEWVQATIKYNGEWITGYIHVNDIEEIYDSQKKLNGYAAKNLTKVYSKTTRDSKVLKSYHQGSKLIFKTFSTNWFEATVYINGKPKTGYIHIDDITFDDVGSKTNYNLTLEEALAIQLTASPQTDKNYDTYVSKNYINKDNEVTADTLNVRGGAGTNHWIVGQLKKGDEVTILKETGNWYQIEYTKTRQWVNASPEDILYYLNPNNFIIDSKQKFQFLDLSKPSGAPASVLNNYLSGKGILSGQGQAFIDSGVQNGINDVYLISHALLETGNGTSTLANGVKYKGVTVYNMFGVNAFDSCPIECGAKKAYEEGWTTPYKAIIGGAKFIDSYINNGQNTLYKMRWNPEAMEKTGQYGKQYATDIGWASKQVNTMYNLYQELDSYILNLDIPVYKK